MLDQGPACWVEQQVGKEVLEMSPSTAGRLFDDDDGGLAGGAGRALVIVEEVPASTALGPLS